MTDSKPFPMPVKDIYASVGRGFEASVCVFLPSVWFWLVSRLRVLCVCFVLCLESSVLCLESCAVCLESRCCVLCLVGCFVGCFVCGLLFAASPVLRLVANAVSCVYCLERLCIVSHVSRVVRFVSCLVSCALCLLSRLVRWRCLCLGSCVPCCVLPLCLIFCVLCNVPRVARASCRAPGRRPRGPSVSVRPSEFKAGNPRPGFQ